jgi:hypothetical protein
VPTGYDTENLERIAGLISRGVAIDASFRSEIINEIQRVIAAASAIPVTPTVVLTVSGGHAEITAVSAPVHVITADLDREGEMLSDNEIDSLLEGSLYTGSTDEVLKAAAFAREGLERYHEDRFAP